MTDSVKHNINQFLDLITGLPIVLAVFPIPLEFPIAFVGMFTDQIQEPNGYYFLFFYFSWLFLSIEAIMRKELILNRTEFIE